MYFGETRLMEAKMRTSKCGGSKLRYFLMWALFFAPLTVFAQSDGQLALAARIEGLSLDQPPPPEPVEPGLEWTLYPPLTSLGQAMLVDGCLLALTAATHENVVISRVVVDLSSATLSRDADGRLYSWSHRTETLGSSGLILFETPPGQPAKGQFRESPRDQVAFQTSHPENWPIIERDVATPNYVMWVDPSHDTVRDLAAAIEEYQRNYCRPLS